MRTRSISLLSTATVVALALVLGACGDDDSSDAGDDTTTTEAPAVAAPDGLVSEGKLTACSDTPYEPFEYEGDDGQQTGFDIDLMREIADDAGLELEVLDLPFEGILGSLAADQCDVITSALSIKPERVEQVDFSDPYFDSGQSLLVQADEAEEYPTLASLAGERIGVQATTTGETYANAHKPEGATIVSFEDADGMFAALASGDVAALLQDLPVNGYRAAKDDSLQLTERSRPRSSTASPWRRATWRCSTSSTTASGACGPTAASRRSTTSTSGSRSSAPAGDSGPASGAGPSTRPRSPSSAGWWPSPTGRACDGRSSRATSSATSSPRSSPRAAWHTLIFTARRSFALGLALALLLALMRLSTLRPYRWFAALWIEVFRGMPALTTIFAVGFAVPIALDVAGPGALRPGDPRPRHRVLGVHGRDDPGGHRGRAARPGGGRPLPGDVGGRGRWRRSWCRRRSGSSSHRSPTSSWP